MSDEGSLSTRTKGRWMMVAAVVVATVLVLASSCSWQIGIPIPEGVPPPAGDPVPAVDTYADGRPAEADRKSVV